MLQFRRKDEVDAAKDEAIGKIAAPARDGKLDAPVRVGQEVRRGNEDGKRLAAIGSDGIGWQG
jgi:hypothetical protein